MRIRTNVMFDEHLKKTLTTIAKSEGISLSEVVNKRLFNSLSSRERLGENPQHLRNLPDEMHLAWTSLFEIERTLPKDLQEVKSIEKKIKRLDATMELLLEIRDELSNKCIKIFNEM